MENERQLNFDSILDAIGDPTQNRHGGNPESIEAYESIQDTNYLRGVVRNYIKAQGMHGATSDEVEEALGMTHQTCAPRFTELKATGEIVGSGEKRKTRQGRNAAVMVMTDLVMDEF